MCWSESGIDPHRIRYRWFFEFAPDCQLVTDFRGVILKANHAAAALLRCRKEFLIDKPLGLFVIAGLRARFYESLARLNGSSYMGAWVLHFDKGEVYFRVTLPALDNEYTDQGLFFAARVVVSTGCSTEYGTRGIAAV